MIKERQLSFDELTGLYKRFLRLIAILPFEGRDYSFLASRILFAYFITSSCVDCVMLISYAITPNKIPTIDTICETVFVVGFNFRYHLLMRQRQEFKHLLDECRAIWESCDEEGRHSVCKFEQKIRRLFYFLLGSSIIINITYALTAVASTLSAAQTNVTDPRVLPCKWFIEDAVNLWPGYKITFAMQVLVINNAGIITTSTDTAAPLLIMLAAGYFRALQNRLLRSFDDRDDPQQPDFDHVAFLRLHQKTLNLCLRIDKMTRSLFFVQLLCTGYNTSLIGIKLVGKDLDRFNFLPLGILNVSQLLICQWASDHLIDESEAISKAAYSVSFAWMKRKIGKLLVIVIARSQRPVQMTAGGIIYLSLENFGSMLTSAVSFFTVLRSFNE